MTGAAAVVACALLSSVTAPAVAAPHSATPPHPAATHPAAQSGAQPAVVGGEILVEVRVHGNHTTPNDEILAIAGLLVGTPVNDGVLREASARLNRSDRFTAVDVRKRLRSIDDPSQVLVIIVVDEVAGVSADDLTPGPLKKIRALGMWLPILDYADGYGFTYGARFSFVETFGAHSRLSVPLTWGGERRVGGEAERTFERGPFSRIAAAAAIVRREHPFFDIGDTRQQVSVRAERAFTSWLRVGGGIRRDAVSFGELDTSFVAPGVDVLVDTRTDPAFPRNAIHVTAGVEQLRFEDTASVVRRTSDLRGYVGLFGSSVLALRATTSHVNAPLPHYEQVLLGGTGLLRGYRFGDRVGDNLAAFSAEVRLPITSPLSAGRMGLKGFVDAGTVYPWGRRLQNQSLDRGVGGGVFFTLTVLRAGLDVAWPLESDSRKPRWHFGLGVTF